MHNGSCLCGQTQYQISGELGPIVHCHCPTCRKAHSTAFSSVCSVNISDFKFTAGEGQMKYFESSPGKKRYFCPNCGSQLFAHRENQAHYILRMGTLDSDPNSLPSHHIWHSLKAPWYDIQHDGQIPVYEQWPEPAK